MTFVDPRNSKFKVVRFVKMDWAADLQMRVERAASRREQVLHIYGPVGTTYRIDYSEDLGTNWLVLTNLILPTNPYLFPDPAPARQAKRFYRAVKQ